MKACFPKSANGTCWRRWCLRCRWNDVTGQSRRREEALPWQFRTRTDACDHEFKFAWTYGDQDWLTCAKRCGTLTYRPHKPTG